MVPWGPDRQFAGAYARPTRLSAAGKGLGGRLTRQPGRARMPPVLESAIRVHRRENQNKKVECASMNPEIKILWHHIARIPSRDYTCGYCGRPLASDQGFLGELGTGVEGERATGSAGIYVCHHCTRPTFFDSNGEQTPGVCYGSAIDDIDDVMVKNLYEEARRATSANCSTAAVLCCRKLLMHIAVDKKAEQDKGFEYYVKYLDEKGYIPPDARGWVDYIRKKGNEANHEIVIMDRDDAKELLDFVEMLLKQIYAFPAAMRKKHPPATAK
jgi:hypothetical protein